VGQASLPGSYPVGQASLPGRSRPDRHGGLSYPVGQASLPGSYPVGQASLPGKEGQEACFLYQITGPAGGVIERALPVLWSHQLERNISLIKYGYSSKGGIPCLDEPDSP